MWPQPELVPLLNKQAWVLKAARVLCARGLKLRAGQRALVHNARLVGPLAPGERFSLDDFVLLERFVTTATVNYGMEGIRKLKWC